MAISITCTNVVKNPDGSYQVDWSNGTGNNFNNVQEIKDYSLDIDADPEIVKRMLLSQWLQQDPAGVNVTLPKGKSASLDLKSQTAINIQLGL